MQPYSHPMQAGPAPSKMPASSDIFHAPTTASRLSSVSAPLKIVRVILATALAVFLLREGGFVALGIAFVITQGTYMLLRRRRARAQ